MEVYYDGALIMPNSYAVMNEEEMSYVEGGYYLDNASCKGVLFALGATAASNPVTVAFLINTVGASGLAASLSTIPVIGVILGGYGAWALINSAESFSSALCTAVKKNKGVEIEIGFRWFSPYLKSTVK